MIYLNKPVDPTQPPVPAEPLGPPANNTMAVVALVSALVGFLVLPILFGPVAIIAGATACQHGKPSKNVALWGLLIGIVDVLWAIAAVTAAANAVRGY
jgi:uncharacterized membrane protein HdeD (DUF308 family)